MSDKCSPINLYTNLFFEGGRGGLCCEPTVAELSVFFCFFYFVLAIFASAEELIQLLLHVHLRHHLVLLPLGPAVRHDASHGPGGGEPRVLEDLPRGKALRGLSAEERPDQALGLGCERLGDVEVAAADLAEQRAGLHVMEGIAPHKDGVKHDAQAPDVSRLPRVAAVGVEDLGTDISRASVFVRQRVIVSVQDISVLEALQLHNTSADTQDTKNKLEHNDSAL